MSANYLHNLTPLGVTAITRTEVILPLWSGYGELVRLDVEGLIAPSLIVKHVTLPEQLTHPRGWSTPQSHQRKVDSYDVEAFWYQTYATQYDALCPMPLSLLTTVTDNQWFIAMEDLSCRGFSETAPNASWQQISACLKWLASFHAKHIDQPGIGLWQSGTYWHLQTRPDEMSALQDLPLKQAAQAIDQALFDAPFTTLVHGDAKLANFCFNSRGDKAAAIDFQYVGKGCAMKDVILFISSAIRPEQCAELESTLLDNYFDHLKQALAVYQPQLAAIEVEQAWRPMFALAWADFQRFVKGWSPNHWKVNAYTESLKEQALQQLKAKTGYAPYSKY
ncbi:phosphotransferase [Vibrio sp. FNV 38]|nr:phosphotransferase [Vibrio sp. FNV 38]